MGPVIVSTATLPFQLMADTIAPIKITDRCDRCGARALVVTTIPHSEGTTDLNWCAHHYRQHQDVLLEIAGAIRDDTNTLIASEEVSRGQGDHIG